MPLTVVEARGAKPADRAYRLADEKGLYLFVTPRGTKSWRQKYRFGGKEKVLTHGHFPEVSLAEARERRDAARQQLRANKDPAIEAERERRSAIAATGATFQASALAWHEDARSTTTAGSDLFTVAAGQYGNARAWTALADANGLTDPQLTGINTLAVPPLPAVVDGILNG